jgi:hypothetical protein
MICSVLRAHDAGVPVLYRPLGDHGDVGRVGEGSATSVNSHNDVMRLGGSFMPDTVSPLSDIPGREARPSMAPFSCRLQGTAVFAMSSPARSAIPARASSSAIYRQPVHASSANVTSSYCVLAAPLRITALDLYGHDLRLPTESRPGLKGPGVSTRPRWAAWVCCSGLAAAAGPCIPAGWLTGRRTGHRRLAACCPPPGHPGARVPWTPWPVPCG